MSNCDCYDFEDIDINEEGCSPPFLSVDTFADFTSRFCSNCTAIDDMSVALDAEDYISYFTLDMCCPVLTIYKGAQIIQSFDGGSTWVETGIAHLVLTTVEGSVTLTAGSTVIPTLNINPYLDPAGLTYLVPATNGFFIKKTGNYIIDVDFIHYYHAVSVYVDFEILVNGGSTTPRSISTEVFFLNGSATEFLNKKVLRNLALLRLTSGQVITFRLYPKNNTMTTDVSFRIGITKLSS